MSDGDSDNEDDGQWEVDETDAIQKVHNALSQAAECQNVTRSTLTNSSTSVHIFSAKSASFGNLQAMLSCVKAHASELRVVPYIGTSDGELIFSCTLGNASPKGDIAPPAKRVRTSGVDHEKERINTLRDALLQKHVNAAEVTAATECVARLVRLQTEEQVRVVESYTLTVRKLATSDTKARLVLAARLGAGLAVPLKALRRAMGEMWVDGLVSSDIDASVGGLRPGDLAPSRSSLVGASLVLVSSAPQNSAP